MTCHDGPDDFDPFEAVTITRVRDGGEPTGLCAIEGLRQGGAREIRTPYADLWDQAERHLRHYHGKGFDDPHTPEEFRHAVTRAAVAFLLD